VNIAVLGAGYWGKKVIGEYLQLAQNHPKVNFSMVCDLQDRNLEYCRRDYDIPSRKLTKSYGEVLKSPDVNAVHICTPNGTHYQICKEALEAGKHVLLEKPMTLNSKHAYELVEIAESEGLTLQVGHIYRFNNALKWVRKLIEDRYLGDLYYLRLQWTTLMLPLPDRDIVFDLAPHPIDIVNYLLDMWPTKVSCKAGNYRREKLTEVAYITAELDGKLLANIELSWLQPGKVRQTSVIASTRCATIDCLNQKIGIYENGNGEACDIKVERNNTILSEITHFTQRILQNEESNNMGSIGARNVEILEHIRRSLEEERTVRVLSSE